MGDVNVHIEELVVEGGTPEREALAAALTAQLGDRLDPAQLAAVAAAVREAVGTPLPPRSGPA